MSTLYNSPTFQKQLLRINALPGFRAAQIKGALDTATAQEATKGFNKEIASREFALKRREADFNLDIARRRLRNQKKEERLGSLLGIGTFGLGILERQRDLKESAEYLSELRKFNSSI
ncbi:MAG: hypothetical protein ACE5HX_04225 [bacterium]